MQSHGANVECSRYRAGIVQPLRAKVLEWIGWTPARPDIARGLRAATATVLPIVAAHELHRPGLIWMALGGWLGTLADTGGAYASRLRAIGGFALGGAVSVMVAMRAGGSLWTAVPAMFTVGLAASMLRAAGSSGGSLATLILVTFAAAMARPGDLHAALGTAGMLLAGCAVALLLALVLWPIGPHRPVRRATAAVYTALATLARETGVLVREGAPASDARWQTGLRARHRALRDALERARAVSGATRARRPGPSAHGDGLRVLIEGGDLAFGALIAAADEFERTEVPDAHAADALAALGTAMESLSQSIDRAIPAADLAATDAALRDGAGTGHGARVLARIATLVHAAAEMTDAIARGPGASARTPSAATQILSPGTLTIAPSVREALRFDALPFQHGVRVAIAATASVLLAAVLPIGHAQWLTLTVIAVLQPSAGLTRGRGVARVLGTVAGGLLAALLAAWVRNPLVLIALMFPLSVAAVAVQPVSYGLFTFFLTPVFVLLAQQGAGDWHVAAQRAVHAALGGTLALVAVTVLWPSWEGRRLRAALARMVRNEHGYLAAVAAHEGRDEGAVVTARRRLGASINDADVAFEQSLGQRGMQPERTAAAQTLLAYARRFAGSITALASTFDRDAARPDRLEPSARRLGSVLDELADTLDGAPLRDAVADVDALARDGEGTRPAQLERAIRSVAVMARAIERARP